MLRLTEHAQRRCAERAIRREYLEFAAAHGRFYQGPGCLVVFFGRHEVARYRRLGSWVEHLHGLVIVLDRDGTLVLTSFKNRRGPRRAGRKRDSLLDEAA